MILNINGQKNNFEYGAHHGNFPIDYQSGKNKGGLIISKFQFIILFLNLCKNDKLLLCPDFICIQ